MSGMVPEDVFALTGVEDPRVSPDGSAVAYVVTTIDGEANQYRSAIWLASLDGSCGAPTAHGRDQARRRSAMVAGRHPARLRVRP